MKNTFPIAFIVGSPRSGTTILSSLLNQHNKIIEFYEPYYLWEQYFDVSKSDIWRVNNSKYDSGKKIKNEFAIFLKKSNKTMVIDKSPYNSFNIKVVNEIFPNAKWIHIIRDGRDVALSINKEWKKREALMNRKNINELFKLTKKMLKRQPFVRNKWMAIKYEFKGKSLLNLKSFFNKSRWSGFYGWGPRFKNWDQFFSTHSLLEFNTMQWSSSVDAVRDGFKAIPDDNKIEIRYEDLITQPESNLLNVFDFLDIEVDSEYFLKLPEIKSDNSKKWINEFSEDQIEEVSKIANPLLRKLGYLK
jgi:hypothetical protein